MDQHGGSDLATPTLMRAARGAYAASIRAQLTAIGVDDLPRNGAFVLAGIDGTGGPRQDLPSGLGGTKQAVSQVVEILVQRGYVERHPDADDRRRVNLELTEHGQEVVAALVRGVDAVDHQLLERVSPEQVEAMRAGLLALAEVKATSLTSGEGVRRRAPQFRRFSPIFPVRHLAEALAHYAALGFETFAFEGGDGYGFANRDGISLHLEANPSGNASSAYLYVGDADAVFAQWSEAHVRGRTEPVTETAYGFREGTHVDPDGNVLRFGSPMDEVR
jgi:DNA-binding MarR family transcriptional regulator